MNKQTKAQYKALFVAALAGHYGVKIQGFYASATTYHQKKGTTFPRPEYEKVALLSVEDAKAFLEKHRATSIPNGDKLSRRLFDAFAESVGSL